MLTRDDAITTVVKFSTPTTIQINDNGVIKDVPTFQCRYRIFYAQGWQQQ